MFRFRRRQLKFGTIVESALDYLQTNQNARDTSVVTDVDPFSTPKGTVDPNKLTKKEVIDSATESNKAAQQVLFSPNFGPAAKAGAFNLLVGYLHTDRNLVHYEGALKVLDSFADPRILEETRKKVIPEYAFDTIVGLATKMNNDSKRDLTAFRDSVHLTLRDDGSISIVYDKGVAGEVKRKLDKQAAGLTKAVRAYAHLFGGTDYENSRKALLYLIAEQDEK